MKPPRRATSCQDSPFRLEWHRGCLTDQTTQLPAKHDGLSHRRLLAVTLEHQVDERARLGVQSPVDPQATGSSLRSMALAASFTLPTSSSNKTTIVPRRA